MLDLNGLFLWGVEQLKSRWTSLLVMSVSTFIIYTIVRIYGLEGSLKEFLSTQTLSINIQIVLAILLFVWSTVLFLTFLPLGTVTVFLGGYVLGPLAGLIQFIALCVASIFIYKIFDRENENQAISDYTQDVFILSMFKRVENHRILTVVLLRIIPVIPSAACVFISQSLRISLRDVMLATLFCGWIRPVFFAALGAKTNIIITQVL